MFDHQTDRTELSLAACFDWQRLAGVILLEDIWQVLETEFGENFTDADKAEMEADLRGGSSTQIDTGTGPDGEDEPEIAEANTSLIWEEDAPEWVVLLRKFRWMLLGARSGGDNAFVQVAQDHHLMEIM